MFRLVLSIHVKTGTNLFINFFQNSQKNGTYSRSKVAVKTRPVIITYSNLPKNRPGFLKDCIDTWHLEASAASKDLSANAQLPVVTFRKCRPDDIQLITNESVSSSEAMITYNALNDYQEQQHLKTIEAELDTKIHKVLVAHGRGHVIPCSDTWKVRTTPKHKLVKEEPAKDFIARHLHSDEYGVAVICTDDDATSKFFPIKSGKVVTPQLPNTYKPSLFGLELAIKNGEREYRSSRRLARKHFTIPNIGYSAVNCSFKHPNSIKYTFLNRQKWMKQRGYRSDSKGFIL